MFSVRLLAITFFLPLNKANELRRVTPVCFLSTAKKATANIMFEEKKSS